MRFELREDGQRLLDTRALEQRSGCVDEKLAQAREGSFGIFRYVFEQLLEIALGEPGGVGGLGHGLDLGGEDRRLRRVTESAAYEIEIECARDRFAQEKRGDGRSCSF